MNDKKSSLTLEQLVVWSKATTCLSPSLLRKRINEVWMDSRKILSGDVFVALTSEKDDGHRYVSAALKAGALAAIVAKKKIPHFSEKERQRLIGVSDPLGALQAIASRYRLYLDIPIIGITGSSGKTTTRLFMTSVLASCLQVGSSAGNFNNHIGVPLSILRLRKGHDIAVLEFGANHSGEISRLTRIARPDVGVISNIGYAHIGLFGSLQNTAEAKLEIVHGIDRRDGLLLINGDDSLLVKKCAEHGYKPLYFGCSRRCGIRAENISVTRKGTSFTVQGFRYRLSMPGRHFIYCALPAIVMARELEIPRESVAETLCRIKPEPLRGGIEQKAGKTFIVDCYNANPSSMKAAITLLGDVAQQKKKVAVVGDMLELGRYSERCHRALGEQLAAAGVAKIIAIGSFAATVADGALHKGMNRKNIHCFNTTEDAVEPAHTLLKKGDVVLVKGSRGMKLEQIINTF